MKKLPVDKIMPLISSLKGKKPLVIIISAVIFIGGIFAVKQGYISEDLLKSDVIVGFVNDIFSEKAAVAVDTLASDVIVDTLKQEVIVDSLLK
jgi:hypothetical protein